MFEELGIPVAQDKLEEPVACLLFLGFALDIMTMEVRLPQQKLRDLKQLLNQWKTRKACCRRDLESLLGELAHAAQVVTPNNKQR